MSATVTQNSDRPLGDLMRNELYGADKFSAASAFLNSSGLECILPAVKNILDGEGEVNVVHGADFRITDPLAINRLVELNARYAKMAYKVHVGWDLIQTHRFHPKLYLWTPDYRSYTAVVGSSNLTRGGLFDNIEVNTIIRGLNTNAAVSQCLTIFDNILHHPYLVEPNDRFAEAYREIHERARDIPFQPEPPSDLLELYRELQELTGDWQPKNQMEYVVKALDNLEGHELGGDVLRDDESSWVHLAEIYSEVERLAREAGEDYQWSTLENSVRRVLNSEFITSPSDGRHFIRRGSMSGMYRLSQAGRNLIRELRQQSG